MDLYCKDNSGNFIPVKINLYSVADLADKLIIVSVGDQAYDVTPEALAYISESFSESDIIKQAMQQSKAADLLIIPYNMNVSLASLQDLKNKTLNVIIDSNVDLNKYPELKQKMSKESYNAIFLPSPITISEYEEILLIKKRVEIRKKRYGGAVSNK